MVIPSSSRSAVFKPHIGSLGSGRFSAARPESQWPAVFPTQHAIVLELSAEAAAIGSTVARNDKAIARAKIFFPQRRKDAKENPRTALRLFSGNILINLIRTGGWFLNLFLDEFHFALGTRAAFFGRDRLMHWAYIVELCRLFGMSRRILFLGCDNRCRIETAACQKKCSRKERHDQKPKVLHFLPWMPSLFLLTSDLARAGRALISVRHWQVGRGFPTRPSWQRRRFFWRRQWLA